MVSRYLYLDQDLIGLVTNDSISLGVACLSALLSWPLLYNHIKLYKVGYLVTLVLKYAVTHGEIVESSGTNFPISQSAYCYITGRGPKLSIGVIPRDAEATQCRIELYLQEVFFRLLYCIFSFVCTESENNSSLYGRQHELP